MNRKQRRAMKNKQKKSDFQEKVSMFEMLPTECKACLKPFDKRNKEMVTSWNVVVREKDKKVNLYCPRCWGAAMDIVKQMQEHEK